MPIEAVLRASTLYAFVLVLSRVSGIFIFLPLPAFSAGPAAARVVLSLVTTFALFPRWPAIQNAPANIGEMVGWMLAELGFGLSIGVAVSVVMEVFSTAAQFISVQAGFSYALTIDPNTDADSGVLVVMAQLVVAVLFFAAGGDRTIITILAKSLDSAPPGTFVLTRPHVEMLVMFAGTIFSTSLRLVLPIMTMLLLVDLALGMIGRLNSQLHLLSLAMPLKMLAALGLLSGSVLMFPRVFEQLSRTAFALLERALTS